MTSDDHVKTLMNFDLGLLSQNDTEDSDNRENTGEKTNQPSVPQLVKSNLELQVKVEKQRKYMNILKERVIKTDLLVDKVKDSKEELVVVNTELAITREDCKNIYTDYQSSLDKCTQLENEIAVIKITNQQLEHKCFHTKSQFEALKSHSHQLQMLVKSHEEEIDTLKAAREKDKTDSKEFDKKISSFEKRNTTLLKHLHRFSKIVQSSKKKLTNRDQKLLKKYEKFNINDQSLSEDSDGGGELFQDCMSYSSLDSSQDADMGKADQISVKRITPLDLDNEAGSIDTGRGSSLAYSNNNSPEYFIGDIHLSKQNIESKSRVKLVSTATSPIPSKTIEISTSPLPTIFVTTGTNTYTENISFGNSRQIKTVNQALSPIISTLSKSIGTSPLKFSIKEAATSPINTPDSEEIHATQEKECLEINNSKNMDIDNTDFEIENILNVMKLDHTLITPIPNTPARTITVVEPANVTNTHHSQSEHANEYACQGAISAIEENKNLLRMIENLTKEVNDIKRNLLKNHVQMESNKEILFSIPSHREDNNRQESNSRTYSPPNERSDTTKLETCYMNTSKRKEVLITCDDKCSESVTELQLSSVEVDLTCNEGSVHSESQARHKSTTSNKRPCNESDDDDIIIFSSNVKKADKDKENSVVAENAQKKNKRPCGESDDDDIIIFSSNVILPPITAETEKDNKKSVVAENTHKNIKSFKSQILFGSSETSDEDSESWQDKSLEVENEHQERVGKKRNKGKVVSKLAKLKKSLKPKYKIKPEVTPLMRSLRSKRVVGKPVCKNYTSTSLNVKDAYEKAVKVMAELKKKDNCNMQKFTPKISPEVQKIFAKQPQKACNDVSINKSLKEENGDVINKLSSSKTKNDNKILDPQKPGANKCVRSNEVKMSNKNLAIDKCNKNVCESNESSISKKENVQEQSKTNSINTIKQSCLSSKNKSLDNFSKNSLGNIKTRNRKSVDENLLNENKVRHNGSSMALKIRRSSEPLPKKSKLMSETKNTKTSTDNGLKIVTRNGSCSKTPNNDLQVSLENSGNKTDSSIESPPKKRRRVSDSSDAQNTRILRSSTLQKRFSPEKDIEDNEVLEHDTTTTTRSPIDSKKHNLPNPIQYDDLDIFSDYENNEMKAPSTNSPEQDTPEKMHSNDPKDSILCTMITKYGVEVVKRYNRKESDTAVNSIAKQLEQDIARIIQLNSNEAQNAMNMIVADLQKLNYKKLIAALIKYLSFPERKLELFGKTCIPPAPAMTKPEQVLLYVIPQLKVKMPHVDIVNSLLENIEYTLFRINCTPEFDVIETMSHFYAVLCRYFHKKSRLRVFILDSMYCLLFKAVPIIKQCLDVWMHIIPLAHMGIAKSPLVTTLVYLLHFYKCDDKFNRIQEIRTILTKKYFYNVTEWNDSKILEMFRNAITELKDNQAERKMLRLALIILAKRQEHQWCQNNIIKNILQPLIENDKTPESIKEFCISVMGPIMKPYPVDMKVYCEIAINQMTSIIQQNSSRRLKDAAIGSMMYLSRHNQNAINQTLLSTKMDQISLEQEDQIRDYIRSKPLKVWKGILTRLAQN